MEHYESLREIAGEYAEGVSSSILARRLSLKSDVEFEEALEIVLCAELRGYIRRVDFESDGFDGDVIYRKI